MIEEVLSTKLPLQYEKTDSFWQEYSDIHMQEHTEYVSYINSMYEALEVDLRLQAPPVMIADYEDKEAMELFYSENFDAHQQIYYRLNDIGSRLTVPIYVFPKSLPRSSKDTIREIFLADEWDLHFNVYRAIAMLIGG